MVKVVPSGVWTWLLRVTPEVLNQLLECRLWFPEVYRQCWMRLLVDLQVSFSVLSTHIRGLADIQILRCRHRVVDGIRIHLLPWRAYTQKKSHFPKAGNCLFQRTRTSVLFQPYLRGFLFCIQIEWCLSKPLLQYICVSYLSLNLINLVNH